MIKILYFVTSILMTANIAFAKEVAFIEGLEDVPLMSGLEQKINETVSFGNEESRFIEVSLETTKYGFKKIEKFYKESLPQLGWHYQESTKDTLTFYRDSEILIIQKETNNPVKIRITVKNRS